MPREPLLQALKDVPASSKIRGYRYLTCQGGGAKGGGFESIAELFESMGLMSQFEVVAGTSAGAIFATLLAVGYTAKEIKLEMKALDFRSLQDKETPGWMESTGLPDLLSPGSSKPELSASRGSTAQKLSKLSHQVSGGVLAATEDMLNLAFGSQLGVWKGDALLSLMQRLIARKTGKPNLTFRELAALSNMQPGVFRKLILTGSNLSTKELEYYSAEEWPDMPIMTAISISTRVPGAFKPYTQRVLKRLNGLDGKPEYSEGVRVDGGLLENLPDVFNKPPYFTPTERGKANPEVLALSFKEKQSRKSEIGSAMALLGAVVSTARSEKQLREQYGDSIVYIDTEGVGTLDFDASQEKRQALANSGWNATQQTLSTILENEKGLALSDLSLNSLLRHKAALLMDPNSTDFERSEVNAQIAIQAKKEGVSKEVLSEKEKYQLDCMRRLLKAKEKGEAVALTDEELTISCQRKIDELNNIAKEQSLQLKDLELALAGFELRRIEFQGKFYKKGKKDWVEFLESQLSVVKNIRERIKDVKLKFSALERESYLLKEKLENKQLTGDEYSKAQSEIEGVKITLSMQKEDLMNEKEKFIAGVIAVYKHHNDDFMCNFFEELKEEFDKPESLGKDFPDKFRFPETMEDMSGFITQQQIICKKYLSEARELKNKTKEEIVLYKARMVDFQKRTPIATRYETLKKMEKELERSVFEKTSFMAKVNHYFTSGRPTLKNNIITGVMQFIAATAFVSRMVVATAVAALPISWPYVYRLYKHSKSDSKAKADADRFLRALSMPNLFKLNKLKYLSKVTSDVVSALDKNYEKADRSEHLYLHKLHQAYLRKAMKEGRFSPNLDDIFPRKEEDTQKTYEERLSHFEQELTAEEGAGGLRGPRDMRKFPVFKNLEVFHDQIQDNLQRKGYLFPLKSEFPLKRSQEKQMLWKVVRNQNVEQSHVEFLKKIDDLIRKHKPNKAKPLSVILNDNREALQRAGTALNSLWLHVPGSKDKLERILHLSEDELIWKYIEAAKAVKFKLPDYICEGFEELMRATNINDLSTEKMNIYLEVAEHYQLSLPEAFLAKKQELTQTQHLSTNNEQGIHAGLNAFYKQRKNERDKERDQGKNKAPKPPKRPTPKDDS